jgi:hypothetical protein
MRPIAILMTLLLTSCAGTQSHVHMLESQGFISVDVADDPGYDYKVSMKNAWDFGWNGNNEEDRISAVKLLFEENCQSVEVIDQKPIPRGSMLGRDLVTWVMKVKCVR